MAIALLTDFGTRDYFVAAMKGVILSINPRAVVVDITHEVPPQDVWTGAFILASAYKWFPKGTIFVAVVDPGVGTERAPLLLRTRRYFFVGPDNGVLSLAAEEDGVEEVYRIEARLPRLSATFHGRDVFAPAAAYLSLGVEPRMLGTPAAAWVRLGRPSAEVAGGEIRARTIYVDRFGNVYTSARGEVFQIASWGDVLCIEVGGRVIEAKFVETYGRARPGETVALINSEGYLEVAVAMGSAAAAHGLKAGLDLKIRRCS
ncbi:S-adenosyl-l-methionine hydroxide adenosyltransferase family protein [Pyrobaculum sp. 3827-6]|uniref:SAM hydrolase/SAM-dependent halogenase family protein n=1 Tax=Pyrobaculum sp. 3827-6 TaxID=2983604 RepID=UPI0021DA1246|nr:S-adenosyl-l-methionine hydroxide adenosyltransferase family protein [Pyrobaculum sp. 3827-6]MCU7786759.1 S-adenosyl-l-methionine hydroxide adenosyltransferase family protein [Pyrobaculum sp. 3827-6]